MAKKFLLFLFIFSSSSCFSSNPTETDGIKGNFDLGLNYTQNIEKTLQFNNVFLLGYKKGNSHFSLGNNISFIKNIPFPWVLTIQFLVYTDSVK